MSKTSVITENGSLGLGLYFLFCCVALRGKFVPSVLIGKSNHLISSFINAPYSTSSIPVVLFLTYRYTHHYDCYNLCVGLGDLLFFNIWHTAVFTESELTNIELIKVNIIELVCIDIISLIYI